MNQHEYRAFLACLVALVVLVGIAAFLAWQDKSVEAVGVGAAITGLIGIMRAPQAPASDIRITEEHPRSNTGFPFYMRGDDK